jgi:hypothetical protein
MRALLRVLVVLWVGSLWSLALWVTPTLFFHQGDRRLAGVLAGQLFSIETYLGLVVALLAILLSGRAKYLWGFAAVVVLSINEWATRPALNLAHANGRYLGLTFGAWHGVSAIAYGLACLAALLLIWKNDLR